jgi:hypothetical protein
MTDTTNYKDFQKLSAKDIQFLLITISIRTAETYLKEIKEHFETKIVTYKHFKNYYNIP